MCLLNDMRNHRYRLVFFQEGLGVIMDADEARKWFAKASVSGLADPAR